MNEHNVFSVTHADQSQRGSLAEGYEFCMPPSELGEIINFNVCHKRLPEVGVGIELEWQRLYGTPGDVTDISERASSHTLFVWRVLCIITLKDLVLPPFLSLSLGKSCLKLK